MDIKSVSAIFSSITGAIQEIWKFKLDRAVEAQIRSLSQLVMTAQTAMFTQQETIATLQRKNDDLEREVLRLTEWGEDKKNYHLYEPIPGTLVRRYRPDEGENQGVTHRVDPPHDLCPRCFDKNEKSILQGFEYQGHRVFSKKCFSCGLVAYVDNPPKSTVAIF